jgi:hypothetical protein
MIYVIVKYLILSINSDLMPNFIWFKWEVNTYK